MIKVITSVESLEGPIRTILLQQSGLDGNHVLNALNVRGPAMEKPNSTIGEVIFESMSIDESIIVFELYEKETYSEEDVDSEKLFNYVELGLKLVIYGKQSRTLAQMLKSRLLSSEVRDSFFSIGLHLQKIDTIESTSEYVNDVLWQRRDFEVSLSCYLSIDKVSSNNTFTTSAITEIDKIS